ncbi:internal virion protein [Kosakonia phage Kc166A]|uniref:Internal virion protein n=1 Tax=Kosakonia phage Kc166A TaxID=2801381 RepID=A0AAE7RHF0_9CAUD|nr:internal virion protein [Kosakonia phage Kc166A]
MCEPVSIGLGVLGVAGATMSASQQAKAEGAAIDAQHRQAQEMVKQMNYSDANLRMQERDLKEQQVAELTETTLNGIRNQGMVRAAIAESGLEGASMDRIERDVAGQTVKDRAGITESYNRDYAAIFGNRIANIQNTQASVNGMGAIIKTNPLAHALNVVSAGASGYAMGSQLSGGAKSGGKAPISAAKGTPTGHS